MRHYRTEGVIIRRRNFGEADRILTIFTKKSGKIKIKAPGVRKISSRRSSHVELLNLSLLTLYKGRNLPILIEAQSLENFSLLKEDLIKIGFAYHICELIEGLCPENQENRSVFYLLTNTLERLAKEDNKNIAYVIHEFEIKLLTILGFWHHGRSLNNINIQSLIENILERKLKSKKIFSKFSGSA